MQFMSKFIVKLMLELPENPVEELTNEKALKKAYEDIQKLQQENNMLKLEMCMLKIKKKADEEN